MEDVLREACRDPNAYPLWTLINARLMRETSDLAKSIPWWWTKDGEKYLPVFTDDDLAERFIANVPDAGDFKPISLDSFGMLSHALRASLECGVPNVGTDFFAPNPERAEWQGKLRSIAAFLEEEERYRDAQGGGLA
jgi:hypothetical protein